jgi:hypothetical protein
VGHTGVFAVKLCLMVISFFGGFGCANGGAWDCNFPCFQFVANTRFGIKTAGSRFGYQTQNAHLNLYVTAVCMVAPKLKRTLRLPAV